MSDLALITAQPADAGRVLDLLDRFRRETKRPGPPGQAEVVRGALADPRIGRAYLAVIDGQDIGLTIVFYQQSIRAGGGVASIGHLYMLPEHRRQGNGRAFLSAVIDDCRALGLKRCMIEADLNNLGAVKLYASLGFRKRSQSLLSLDLDPA